MTDDWVSQSASEFYLVLIRDTVQISISLLFAYTAEQRFQSVH